MKEKPSSPRRRMSVSLSIRLDTSRYLIKFTTKEKNLGTCT